MKKRFGVFIGLIIILCSVTINIYGIDIHDFTTTDAITNGIVHTNIKRLTTAGYLNIDIAEIDLSYPEVALMLLNGDNTVNTAANVLKMAQDSDCDVAVNTDFFQRAGYDARAVAPIGTAVRGGEFLSSPSDDSSFATFALTKDRIARFDYWTYYISLIAANGNENPIRYINKYNDSCEGIVLYDKNWGYYSLGTNAKDKFEVVVDNGIVTDILTESNGVHIPEKGYVLACDLTKDTFLLDNVEVGDELTLRIWSEPDYNMIDLASGGGSLLVRDGARAKNTHNISGLQPRTAVGSDASGKKIYLVTIDGRSDASIGVSMDYLADFMLGLGCRNAINMDGGGSTTFVARQLDNSLKILNKPSDGSPRTVSTALGARYTQSATGILNRLEITPLSSNCFAGTSCYLDLKAYDTTGRPMSVPDGIVYKVESGGGAVNGNRFYASQVGAATVSASLGGVAAYYDINVLSEPVYIEARTDKLSLPVGERAWITLWGRDKNGYSAPIHLSDTEYYFSSGIASVEDNSVVASAKGTALLTASVNGKSAYLKIVAGGADENIHIPENDVMPDEWNRPPQNAPDNFTFTVFGDSTKPTTLLGNLLYDRLINRLNNESEFCTFLGSFPDAQKNKIQNTKLSAVGYGCSVIEGCTFIRIDTAKGGIRATRADQWEWLLTDIQSVNTKNVFILLSGSILADNFRDRTELAAFKEKINEYLTKRGKNVFVFYPEWHAAPYEFDLEDGVRYIGLRGFRDASYPGLIPGINDYGFLKVCVQGDDISYNFEKLF